MLEILGLGGKWTQDNYHIDAFIYVPPAPPASSSAFSPCPLLLHLDRQPLPELTPRLLIRRHALHARLPTRFNQNPHLALPRPDRVPRRRPSLLVRIRV